MVSFSPKMPAQYKMSVKSIVANVTSGVTEKDKVFVAFLFASTFLSSAISAQSASGLHYVYPNREQVTDKSYSTRESRDHHMIQKRAVSSDQLTAQPETVVCNDAGSTSRWTCTCYGCIDETASECCLSLVDEISTGSVVIVLSNLTLADIDSKAEIELKTTFADVVSKYCKNHATDCFSQADLASASSSFAPDQIVFVELRFDPDEERYSPDRFPMSIALFVLKRGPLVSSGTASILPAEVVMKALNDDKETLGNKLGRDVLAVVISHGAQDDDVPVKAIAAGSVLGFFLALSCIISAVKAVRDRRLIKQRNSAKRERRRQQELRESIRRSPLKQKLEEIAAKSSPNTATSNGDARPSPLSSDVIRVMVHTSNESLNGGVSSNGKTIFPGDKRPQNAVITHGEVHVTPNSDSNDDVIIQDDNTGHVDVGDEAEMWSSKKESKPRTTKGQDIGVPPIDESEKQSMTSLDTDVNTDVGVINPHPTGSGILEENPANGSIPDINSEQAAPRPGLVNQAYCGE